MILQSFPGVFDCPLRIPNGNTRSRAPDIALLDVWFSPVSMVVVANTMILVTPGVIICEVGAGWYHMIRQGCSSLAGRHQVECLVVGAGSLHNPVRNQAELG